MKRRQCVIKGAEALTEAKSVSSSGLESPIEECQLIYSKVILKVQSHQIFDFLLVVVLSVGPLIVFIYLNIFISQFLCFKIAENTSNNYVNFPESDWCSKLNSNWFKESTKQLMQS